MRCRVFPMEEAGNYKYVVVLSRYRGRLLLSRHRKRATWETQGGHIEPGETAEQAARRELWEESGAKRFSLAPLCGYRATDGAWEEGANGAVFFADIQELGPMPEREMAEVGLFDSLPENLTYPGITPRLWERLLEAGWWQGECE